MCPTRKKKDGKPYVNETTFSYETTWSIGSKFESTHVVRFRLALGFFSDSTPSFEYAASNRKDDSSDKLDESAALLPMLKKLDSPTSLIGMVDAILIAGDV